MEGVDHVHVVQVRGGGLVGQVHRMLQRQVPDGEGLELGIARVHAPLVLVVELAQAGGHLAAAGAGGGDHHQAALGFDIVVLAEALVRDDERDVGGVIRDDVVLVGADAQSLQPLDELVRQHLAPVVGEDHAPDIKADVPEGVDEAQGVLIIGDAQIAPALGALDIVRRDGDDDLRLVLHLQQHLHLAVRLETRQDPGGVIVVKKLAAELQIKLAEMPDPLPDLLGLELHILVIVKADAEHVVPSRFKSFLTVRHFSTVAPQGQEDGKNKNEVRILFFFIIMCYTPICIVIARMKRTIPNSAF